ncbi:uncharacterized protein BDV17DRAFT_263945 [Aspergillus undulatus]|uniref:uncharacterized protein n=1 Tax=Aspergillus undulatus TaxID=1810928 RepID=UPI003CCD4F9A
MHVQRPSNEILLAIISLGWAARISRAIRVVGKGMKEKTWNAGLSCIIIGCVLGLAAAFISAGAVAGAGARTAIWRFRGAPRGGEWWRTT